MHQEICSFEAEEWYVDNLCHWSR